MFVKGKYVLVLLCFEYRIPINSLGASRYIYIYILIMHKHPSVALEIKNKRLVNS